MKLKIRNPFYWVKKDDPETVKVVCFHCGAIYRVGYKEIRVANYCSMCK
jgi:hypothetical protein